MTKKAVIFDLYGTLVDIEVDEESEAFWSSLAATAFKYGCVSGETLRRAFERLLRQSAATWPEGFLLGDVLPKLLEEFGVKPNQEAVGRFGAHFRATSIRELTKKPYTDELLYALREKGYKLGLVSNTEALLTEYDLHQLELESAFNCVLLSSQIGVKKPDPLIFRRAIQELDVEASEAVFVGDNYFEDIEGAVTVGIDAVYLGTAPAARKSEVEARVMFASFKLESIKMALQKLGVLL